MTRLILTLATLITLIAVAVSASTRTYFGFAVGISNAPPPPVVVFDGPPVCVPYRQVYVVSDDYDYDMFRYGSYWYVTNGGYWYRARSYRGPFAVVDVRYVPRPIFYVPTSHWKHHPHGGPPGLSKRYEHHGKHDKHGDGYD